MALFTPKSKSSSIPVPMSHVRRSSEIQLKLLEHERELYEYRHVIVYHRLINGMLRRGREVGNHSATNETVRNIVAQAQATLTNSSEPEESLTSGSTSSEDGEWFFRDESWKEQHIQVPLASSDSRQYTSSPSSESGWVLEAKPCPTLRMETDRGPQGDCEDSEETIFELDL